jgi:hypothetical protein
MSDQLSQAAEWLNDQRQAHLARTVTYRRGGLSVQLSATRGQTVFRLADGYGATVRTVQRDYLVAASDLILDGAVTLPIRGDQIVDDTEVYEVMGPGSNEPDWRFADPDRLALRIHVKHVATEA